MGEKRQRKRLQDGAGHSVRLLDVALEAEVSTATVSRALNDPGKVRPDLAERVHAAIRRLGYVPHGAARALASHRSQTVGAVVPTLDNAIFARGIGALQQRLSEDGYTLLLAMSEYDLAREVSQVGKLIERGIDGLMLIGEAHDPGLYAMLDAKGLPYINTWVFREASAHPCIGFKNSESAHRIAHTWSTSGIATLPCSPASAGTTPAPPTVSAGSAGPYPNGVCRSPMPCWSNGAMTLPREGRPSVS